jgi:hypothetical protein
VNPGGSGGGASTPTGGAPGGEGGAGIGIIGGGAGGSGGSEDGCERVHDTRGVAPNVQIVLDRSGSMIEDVDRWGPAVAALGDLTDALEGQIGFGLTVFPALSGGCGTGDLRLAPALNQGGAIVEDLQGPSAPSIGGGTPTSATLAEVEALLTPLDGTSYVLLVTDGAPNCNSAADPATCSCTREPDTYCRGGDLGGGAIIEPQPALCLDDEATIAQVASLAGAGIRTFVIGYDTLEWSPTLDAMAAAGDTERDTHYPVSDGSALAAALEAISAFVVTCTFELSEAPPRAEYVSVTVDGTPVANVDVVDGDSGWRLEGDRVVTLVGDWCRAVSDGGEHSIEIVRECEPVDIR